MNLLRGPAARAPTTCSRDRGARRPLHEAAEGGRPAVAWTDEDDGFVRVPDATTSSRRRSTPARAYAHITTNETIHGRGVPDRPRGPSPACRWSPTCRRTSCRGRSTSRATALIYAGAQKNAGPAGVTSRSSVDDLLVRIPDGAARRCSTTARSLDHGSMYNTPPVFSIYVLMLVTRWLRDEVGGLEAQARVNARRRRSSTTRSTTAAGSTVGHADAGSRSLMNVTWRLPDRGRSSAASSQRRRRWA